MSPVLLLPHHLPCHVVQPRPGGSQTLFHRPLCCPSLDPASGIHHFYLEEQGGPKIKCNEIPKSNHEGAGSDLLFGASLPDHFQHRYVK